MNKTQNTDSKSTKLVTCETCLHANLHRYGNNPLLAACKSKPQPDNVRFPFQIEIASTLRKCVDYMLDPNEKTIEQRPNRQAV